MPIVRLVVLSLVLAAVAIPSASALDLLADPNVMPDGVVGQPYHFEFEGEEGCPPSYHFDVRPDSQLPPGLVLERNTGEVTGTPTTPGDWNPWIHLSDDCGHTRSEADFRIRILPALAIDAALPGTIAGRPVNTALAFSGGGTVTWAISEGALPPGLTLSEKGILSGATSAVGTYTFTVKLTDPKRVATKQFSYVVANPLAATPPAPRPGEVGRAFSLAQSVSGGIPPLRWSVASGSLPAGLTLDAATGAISGTPTASGSFPVALSVIDSEGTLVGVNATLAIAARLVLASASLPKATIGRTYSAPLATSGGVRPLRWSLVRGPLPRGIRFDARRGAFVGTARSAGARRVTVRVTDALGATATKTLTLTSR
jgi:hypothetical protein